MNKSLFLLLTICFVCSIGCSQGPVCYIAEGDVTFKGEPLSKAIVSFIPVDPSQGTTVANGMTDDKGHFVLTASQFGKEGNGATPGDYYVTIIRYNDKPSRQEPSPYGPIDVYNSVIPERYGNQAASKLNATVEKKKNFYSFALEEK